ncbi:putative short-chain dehydrogenases/reductase [Aspergillus brunneoviolaceus CBS 621.78]|uniref:Short-chain dehydrogenases/reductase n=1 Tax=Aspergillus brunneoviolaceus CBS 621.78 TaxID=1450534 RepID=A0ACD1G741_9EURO|nr:putative short-chain dehydrogenases/reductase [Aspergillus brunneoviolaceus CBS 621.78]RAH45050.1 putative short-chain dehydrogenases/reductase [Aspergillus brunneoviolaceus CBS 621.78]
MALPSLNFRCALVTGGGGGIGKALSSYLISQGKKVIIAGRTKSKLKESAREIGAAAYYHPDLDCLVNNAGVQRPLKLVEEEPQEILARADQEIDINIRGPMHLTLGLLKHFKNKPDGALIVNVSSVLGFVPFAVINPVYGGSKAWLHFWSMNLRTQLSKSGFEKVRVVEIVPPSVATDLHRERDDPDDNKKDQNPSVLSVEEFMEEVSAKLERGDEAIAPGMSADIVRRWYEQYEGFCNENAA